MIKTIYADPPWKIYTGGMTCKTNVWGTPQQHYPVMKTQDICNLGSYIKEITDEQAHLWMWAVSYKLEDALKVIDAWGFKYITNMVWVKNKIGIGQYIRGQHELLLFARKGDPMPYKYIDNKKVTISSVVVEDRQQHSKKPDTFYDIIEKISYPEYLELFARQKRQGWLSWGNEIESDISIGTK